MVLPGFHFSLLLSLRRRNSGVVPGKMICQVSSLPSLLWYPDFSRLSCIISLIGNSCLQNTAKKIVLNLHVFTCISSHFLIAPVWTMDIDKLKIQIITGTGSKSCVLSTKEIKLLLIFASPLYGAVPNCFPQLRASMVNRQDLFLSSSFPSSVKCIQLKQEIGLFPGDPELHIPRN